MAEKEKKQKESVRLMDWQAIHQDLKKKIYYPVYLLMGEEPFYVDVISGIIEKTVLDDNEKEFNQTVLYGKETDIPTIISTAKRFPMMANHQVVIIKEAQNLKEIELLEHYVTNPLQSTILVLCYKYKTVDKRKTFYKSVGSAGVIMESKKVYDNQMPGWISRYVSDHKYKISAGASQLLADHLGNDLGKVVNEIQKVFISLPKGQEITHELIEKNIGISKDFNVFELQDALATRNSLKAFRIVKYFGDNPKSNPNVVTLAVLHGFFVRVMTYHTLKDKSPQKAGPELGMSPFLVPNIQKGAQAFPMSRLPEIFSYLREYDLKSKGVNNQTTSQGELLKELVIKILQ